MSITNAITGGAFQDTEGNVLANGYLTFELSQDCIVNTSTMICAGKVINVPLDSNGNVSTGALWPVDLINLVYPTLPLYYTVTAYSAAGQKVWGPYPQSILSSPSPFDLGTLIPGKL
jgi:hypothetical protein